MNHCTRLWSEKSSLDILYLFLCSTEETKSYRVLKCELEVNNNVEN